MPKQPSSKVSFDVLLRGETDDVSVAAASLEKLRPPAAAIERCFRWLSARDVTCHRTDFGLACEAKVDVFERLFDVQLTRLPTGGATPPSYQLKGEPRPPSEIESLVWQITLTQPPTFFN